MEKQFATYEIALAVKELGFNERCLTTFDDGILNLDIEWFCLNSELNEGYVAAPLWQQVIDWFEDKHKLVLQYDDRTAGCRGLNWLSPTIIRLTSYGSENATSMRFRNSIFYNKKDAREQTILNAIKVLNENMVK